MDCRRLFLEVTPKVRIFLVKSTELNFVGRIMSPCNRLFYRLLFEQLRNPSLCRETFQNSTGGRRTAEPVHGKPDLDHVRLKMNFYVSTTLSFCTLPFTIPKKN